MTIFVDTSAFYALSDRDAGLHPRATDVLNRLKADGRLLTHNYVVVESVALIHRRLGRAAVHDFRSRLLPLVQVVFVDEITHERALSAFNAGGPSSLSFVDCVSFDVIRTHVIEAAFVFDRHFDAAGCTLLS